MTCFISASTARRSRRDERAERLEAGSISSDSSSMTTALTGVGDCLSTVIESSSSSSSIDTIGVISISSPDSSESKSTQFSLTKSARTSDSVLRLRLEVTTKATNNESEQNVITTEFMRAWNVDSSRLNHKRISSNQPWSGFSVVGSSTILRTRRPLLVTYVK